VIDAEFTCNMWWYVVVVMCCCGMLLLWYYGYYDVCCGVYRLFIAHVLSNLDLGFRYFSFLFKFILDKDHTNQNIPS